MANEKYVPLQDGDTVMLKSGGPIMTVFEVRSYVICIWFEGTTRLQGEFSENSLKKVDPKDYQ